jgi:hypothetical protein
VKEQTFSSLVRECQKSLERLMAESQQTLALMNMVNKYPQDAERKAALQLQCHREDRLRLAYLNRRRELLQLMGPADSESDTAA